MRKALMMAPIAVLMAAMPLSAGAADADSSAKAKMKTGAMDGTRSDVNYPRAGIDDNDDGEIDAEGNIVAGIDHDRDPATPTLYAVDMDGDGVGDRWVSRQGDSGAYTTYSGTKWTRARSTAAPGWTWMRTAWRRPAPASLPTMKWKASTSGRSTSPSTWTATATPIAGSTTMKGCG